MARVIHFEIHADDPTRAASFYAEVFGWNIQKWDGPEDYWLAQTGPAGEPGIDGAILKRQGPLSSDSISAYVCTLSSTALDDDVASVQAHGGTIALPRMAVNGIGWLAYCKDTEGNIFGIMQRDPSAA